jgi:DNA-binding phage protein
MSFDYKKVSCELLTAARGEMSRSALARRLATGVENVTRWESGSRRISWGDFADICDVTGRNLKNSLKAIFSFLGESRDGCAIARQLLGAARLTQVARDTGISRFTLMRWQQNKSEPSLMEMLQIMHACQFMMLEFIAHLVDISTVPEAWGEYSKRRERKEIYYRMPVVAGVLCCLKLDDYKALPAHQVGFIARKVGISEEEEAAAVEKLLEVGKIIEKDGRYEAIDEQLELTDSEAIRSFSHYWLHRAADFCEQAENPSPIIGFGMDIQPTSKATLKLLRDEYCAFYQRVRALLNQDNGPRESVYVFQSLFFDLDKRFEQAHAKNNRLPKPQQRRGDDSINRS